MACLEDGCLVVVHEVLSVGVWELVKVEALVHVAGFSCFTEEVFLAAIASGDWVGFFTVLLEYEDNVFVFKEVRSWPGCLDSVALIKCGLKEGWVCDVHFTALACEWPLFSKSIETEDAVFPGSRALQQLPLGRRRLKWFAQAYSSWSIKVIGHLHFFFVSDENESLFTISSKLYHIFYNDEKVQMGHSRSDAQLKMSTVSTQVPVILLFLTWSSMESKEKSSGSNTFGFLSIKLELDLQISSCFSSLTSSFQRAFAW